MLNALFNACLLALFLSSTAPLAQEKLSGSTEYLYAGEIPNTHGRQPGTLASLAINREKKTRELLAEVGLPLDSLAVGVEAAKKALLAAMPDKAHAMTQVELFEKAGVITKTTGQKALQQLLYTGEIRRFGKGGPLDLYRYYFKSGQEPTQTRKPTLLPRTRQNSALLKVMRGEERNEE